MEEAIKVSVLIPAYNVEQYIDQCLESVINQTLPEIEILVVDDASTDTTLAHVKAAAEKDGRIRILQHTENLGLFQTRKDAVLVSRGEYIMFVNSDDYLELNACELAYEKARETDVDVLQFGAVIENCGNLPQDRINKRQLNAVPYMGPLLTEPLITARFVEKKLNVTVWGTLFKGDLARAVYTEIPDGYYYSAEDWLQVFYLLMKCRSYLGMENQMYHYCYGRGLCGCSSLSLRQFDQHTQNVKVYQALDRYVTQLESEVPEDEEEAALIRAGREAVTVIKKEFVRANVNHLLKFVKREDRAAAFLILENCWKDVVPSFAGLLAENFWGKRKAIAEALADAEYLKFERRPIKTVALYFYKLRNGGAERVVSLVSSLLAEVKDENGNPRYRVVLITEEAPNEEDYPVSPLVIREQIPHREESIAENYPHRAEAWGRIVREYEVDVVLYSHWRSIQHLWDLLSIKRTGRNPAVVIHSHNWCGALYQERADRVDERAKIFPLDDGIVVLSELDRQYWSRINPRTFLIPNPCFTKASTVNRASFGKHILWLARISEQKQPLEITRIMAEIADRDPEIVCHVVGSFDEALQAKLEESIRTEGLTDRVIMEGFHPDVTPFYESCSLFLMTSREEGFELTLYEAACYGMPTVMYELLWLPYCTDMEGGVSVRQRDAKAAAEAIVRIVNDPAEWQARSDALYQSALKYEQIDITGYWLSLLSDLEQGIVPEYPEIDSTTKIFLDQMDYFHGIAVRGLVKERNTHQKRAVELEGLLEASLDNEKKAQGKAKKRKPPKRRRRTKRQKPGNGRKKRWPTPPKPGPPNSLRLRKRPKPERRRKRRRKPRRRPGRQRRWPWKTRPEPGSAMKKRWPTPPKPGPPNSLPWREKPKPAPLRRRPEKPKRGHGRRKRKPARG